MTQQQREKRWPELLKRLCAHLCQDPATADEQYQAAQKLLKGRKSTGFESSCADEAVYIDRIRNHLRIHKDSEAADKFLVLSGRLTLLSNSPKNYVFYRKALYSFLLTVAAGVDDTSPKALAIIQPEKINEIFRRKRGARPVDRPLSTPCAISHRNGHGDSVKARPVLNDGQPDAMFLRSILNLLAAQDIGRVDGMKDQAIGEVESRFQFSTDLKYRIISATEIAKNLCQLTQFQFDASKSRSLVVQRLSEALGNQLLRHKQLVAVLEQMNMKGKLSLARLEYLCLRADNLIHTLHDILSSIIDSAAILKGNHVLDVLYKQAAALPVESVRYEIVNTLLKHSLQPWLSMLRAWMLRGQLAHTTWDFFIHDVGRQGVSNLWYDKFIVKMDYLPAFLNEDDSRKILSVGKAMVFLKEADDVHRVAEVQKRLAEAMGPEDAAVDVRPAYELAMQRMKTVIIDQFHLKTHLILLRDVVLLYDGKFSKALLSSISEELSENSGGLLTDLERSEVTRMVYRLLPELPEVEASSYIGVHFDDSSNGSTSLESFGLKYILQEPLSFVLQKNSFVLYNRIFAHLFRVRKFSFLFTSLSAEIQMMRPKTNEETYVVQMCRFLLHEIMNFIINLESYQFSHVVTTAWTELSRRVDTMASVDDLSNAHNAFVQNLLKGLFIEGEDSAGLHLRDLFMQIESIYGFVRGVLNGRHNLRVSPEAFKRYELDKARYRSTMLEFLRILSDHEDDKMVQFLWMNFDFNQFYSDKHYSLIMSFTQGHRKLIKTNKSMNSTSFSDVRKVP